MTAHESGLNFDNTYARDMEGLFMSCQGAKVPDPKICVLNRELAGELGVDANVLNSVAGAELLSGSTSPEGAEPVAMAYAGHQFGGFVPQLGDGRALLVGEIIDSNGDRRDIHLKGSGRTPYSRGGDGKAPLGPVLREYLIAEAMHALGIPTTRALAAVTTGEAIHRNGMEPGAVLTRVAASHIRVGTFQFVAARGDDERLKRLADYVIARHYPDVADHNEPYLELLRRVRDVQAALVAKWMLVGFVHGVMNTDNTTVSGETIDFGPCAFIDSYDENAVFSSIDRYGRYAYSNQPLIAQWNVTRFAECLIDLINPDDTDDAIALATVEIEALPERYESEWLSGMRAKLGLATSQPEDLTLAQDLFDAMQGQDVDFTGLFRALSTAVIGDAEPARALFENPSKFDAWLARFAARGEQENSEPTARAAAMNQHNPLYIPRNHLVEQALAAAVADDMQPFTKLLEAISSPYNQREGFKEYEQPAPSDFGRFTTFCGT